MAALGLLLTACGGGGERIDHPVGAGELVLRVEAGGGLVPPDYNLHQLPSFSLYGDGRLVTPGPQIALYPGPALPNLLERPLTEEGVQAILAAARDAGLLGPNRHYDAPGIMDAATTTFTVVADGAKHVISAYALGLEVPSPPGVSEEELEARKALLDFSAKLFDGSWLPEGSLGEEAPYAFTELRVYVRPYDTSPEPGLEQPERPWPLAEPLASFGRPAGNLLPDLRCGAVSGEELATLLPEAQASNELTPWASGGARYLLVFRPLLPDEHGC